MFGGIGKNSEGLLRYLMMYTNTTPKPIVGLNCVARAGGHGGPCDFCTQRQGYVTGGVNQNIFNGYFEDLNELEKIKPL